MSRLQSPASTNALLFLFPFLKIKATLHFLFAFFTVAAEGR